MSDDPSELHDPLVLQVLAELELVKRKAQLLERRVQTWEARQREHEEAMVRIGDTEVPDHGEAIAAFERRLDRLEAGPRLEPSPILKRVEPELPPELPVDDTVALVRARWIPPRAGLGDRVILAADCDGIPPGTEVAVTVRSVANRTPLTDLLATSDGTAVHAAWVLPKDLEFPALYFDLEHCGAVARSEILEVIDRK